MFDLATMKLFFAMLAIATNVVVLAYVVLLVAARFSAAAADRLDWFYRKIADNCPKPLWMYTSGNWSKPVTPAFVAALKSHPNIAGIKFSKRDTVDVTEIAGMADEEFQVITAVPSSSWQSGSRTSSTSTPG